MGRLDAESETLIPTIGGVFDVAHTLKSEGFDASEDGTGRGTRLVTVAFGWQNSANQGASVSEHIAPTLDKSKTPAVATYAIQERAVSENIANGPQGKGYQPDHAYTLEARNKVQAVSSGMAVRRLTPIECERLQGFPDGYTDIRERGKPTPDGPRYKSLGNSMAVPCMRWIGERTALVDAITARAVTA